MKENLKMLEEKRERLFDWIKNLDEQELYELTKEYLESIVYYEQHRTN